MCMGCAGVVALNNDGKLPDTTETIIYAGGFALWILFLVHFKKKLVVNSQSDPRREKIWWEIFDKR